MSGLFNNNGVYSGGVRERKREHQYEVEVDGVLRKVHVDGMVNSFLDENALEQGEDMMKFLKEQN